MASNLESRVLKLEAVQHADEGIRIVFFGIEPSENGLEVVSATSLERKTADRWPGESEEEFRVRAEIELFGAHASSQTV